LPPTPTSATIVAATDAAIRSLSFMAVSTFFLEPVDAATLRPSFDG
jgi:hypothetical protein